MRAYRKKPVVIQAMQWHMHGDHVAVERFVFADGRSHSEMGECCDHCEQAPEVHGWVKTLEGGHIVCPGDWIIRGVMGELYPCKPLIFAATYEPAGEEPEKFGGMELDRVWLDELGHDNEALMRDLALTGTATYTIGIDPAEGEKNGIMRRLLNKVAMRDLFANVPRKLD